MFFLSRRETIRSRFGALTGVFLIGYAVARITGEFFREPDEFLGFLVFGATMGQLLSIPMLLAGLWLALRRTAGPRSD
jgi:phosphatidylglycerol:prolipoprotein diacylglycerol transferase